MQIWENQDSAQPTMDTKQVTVKLGSDTKQTKPTNTKKNNKTQPTVDLHKEFQRAKDEPSKLQLNLSKNNITVIPPSIKELHHLTELYLYGNKIAILPPEICFLTKLQTLALNENQVSESSIKMWGVKIISMSSLFQLNTLPDTLQNLTQLKVLDLRHNKLGELAERSSIFWSKF